MIRDRFDAAAPQGWYKEKAALASDESLLGRLFSQATK